MLIININYELGLKWLKTINIWFILYPLTDNFNESLEILSKRPNMVLKVDILANLNTSAKPANMQHALMSVFTLQSYQELVSSEESTFSIFSQENSI